MITAEDVVQFSRSVVGLTADPNSPWRALYLDLIAPGETRERAAEMATAWNCELVAMAVLRRFIAHSSLVAPYPSGTAGMILMRIAREAHALRPQGALPQAGDVVLVSPPEHAWICLGKAPDTATTYDGATVLDGVDGLPVDGWRAVSQRLHEIRDNIDDAGTRRGIVAVIDTMACVARFGR